MERRFILPKCKELFDDTCRAFSPFAHPLHWQEKIAILDDQRQIARHRQSLRWTLPFCWLALLMLSFSFGCRTSELWMPPVQQASKTAVPASNFMSLDNIVETDVNIGRPIWRLDSQTEIHIAGCTDRRDAVCAMAECTAGRSTEVPGAECSTRKHAEIRIAECSAGRRVEVINKECTSHKRAKSPSAGRDLSAAPVLLY